MGVRKDFLYIGDVSDDTVKRFNAFTGEERDPFVTSGSGGIVGPRGVIFDHMGNLLVSNQNVDLDINGALLRFNGKTGEFLNQVVSPNQEGAPFAPRGIVLSNNNVLYVAGIESPAPPRNHSQGN